MGNRNGQFDMSHALAANLFFGYFYTATVTHDTFVAYALVFSAMAFPVTSGTKYLFAEEAVPLRLVCAIIDSLRFGYLTIRAFFDRLW